VARSIYKREKAAICSLGWEPRSPQVVGGTLNSFEENKMKKLFLLSAAAVLISTGAFAQSTVVTTTGTGHAATVQIEPQYRTKIKSYITEHRVRPVTTKEKIVVGATVPADVELEAVPADWGPSLTKYRYVYSGDRVMLVDPGSRTVVQEID
jgi:Protein of unknown function (DUF1236)